MAKNKRTSKHKGKSRKATATPMQVKVENKELVLHENDVICGRGSGVTNWRGNAEFRFLCWKMKSTYVRAHRADKASIAQKIMDTFAVLTPPGRFVELLEGTEVQEGRCKLVPFEQAMEKTCQALREKKNGCPRQFAHLSSSRSTPGSDKSLDHPKIAPKKIEQLRSTLEKEFFKGRAASRVSTFFKEEFEEDEEMEDEEVAVETSQVTPTPIKPKRLTIRQAVIESKLAADRAYSAPKRAAPETGTMSTHLSSRKRAKAHAITPRKAPEKSPRQPKKTHAKLVKQAVPTQEPVMPLKSDTIHPVGPSTTKQLIDKALDFQLNGTASPTSLDEEMALLPPTLTAFSSGIYSNVTNSWEPAAPLMSVESLPLSPMYTMLTMVPCNSPTSKMSDKSALSPVPLKSYISAEYPSFKNDPQESMARQVTASGNTTALTSPSTSSCFERVIQPTSFASPTFFASPGATVSANYLSQYGSYLMSPQESNDGSLLGTILYPDTPKTTARVVDNQCISSPALVASLSDFFDKKYFPVSARVLNLVDRDIVPLNDLADSKTQQDKTALDATRSIVSYNRALFNDDFDGKDEANIAIDIFSDSWPQDGDERLVLH